jgi:hypothetical protein
MALCVGPDAAGVARWRLSVHDAALPGLWVVVNREFRPAQEEGHDHALGFVTSAVAPIATGGSDQ